MVLMVVSKNLCVRHIFGDFLIFVDNNKRIDYQLWRFTLNENKLFSCHEAYVLIKENNNNLVNV